jgi:hypothetical protein
MFTYRDFNYYHWNSCRLNYHSGAYTDHNLSEFLEYIKNNFVEEDLYSIIIMYLGNILKEIIKDSG